MTATIYKFPDLMPKKQNTLQALADEFISESLASLSLRALDDRLMEAHNGRPFNYQIVYGDEAIEIVVNLKFSPQEE